MYAMRYTRYGSPDVLKRDRVETPPLGATDVLIQVHAAAANAGDWHLLRGDPQWIVITKPVIDATPARQHYELRDKGHGELIYNACSCYSPL